MTTTGTYQTEQEARFADTSPIETNVGVDWLSLTVRNAQGLKNWKQIGSPLIIQYSESYREIKPRNGYTEAIQWDCGLMVMRNRTRPDMGIHCIYSGSALKRIAEFHGTDFIQIVSSYKEYETKISRIDIFIDIYNADAHPVIFKDAFSQKLSTNNRSKGSYWDSLDGKGATLYVGSLKKRKRLLRIYDKASEQGLDTSWTRIELQCSGEYGQPTYDAVVFGGKSLHSAISGEIKAFVDFPTIPIWQKVTGIYIGNTRAQARHETNTEKWLLNTVAKSLALTVSKNKQFWQKFWKLYSFWLNKFESEREEIE